MLSRAVQQLSQRSLLDVAQTVLRVYIVVAAIDVTVVLQHGDSPTDLTKDA
jgi:hypothetical protein